MKTNTQKGSVIPAVIAIVVLLIVGVIYIGSKAWNNTTITKIPEEGMLEALSEAKIHGCIPSAGYLWSDAKQACVRPWEEKRATSTVPVITSITPSSGPIGTIIELKGTNLAGFEGDLDAWIENSKGEIAFLPGIGSTPRADQTIRIKIDSQLCKGNNNYSGLPCTSYLTITPGVYNIYTQPWGKTSNKVKFTVTSTNSGLVCPTDIKICSNGSYVVRSDSNCEFKACPATITPSITVISPNGGEKLVIGQNYTFHWLNNNAPSNVTLRLQSLDRKTQIIMANQIPNTGSYNWTIREYPLIGNGSLVKFSVYAGESGIGDASDNYLTITN